MVAFCRSKVLQNALRILQYFWPALSDYQSWKIVIENLLLVYFWEVTIDRFYCNNVGPMLSTKVRFNQMYETNVQQSQKRLLEAIHTEAARLVSGSTKLYIIHTLFMDLVLESPQSRLNSNKFLLFIYSSSQHRPNYFSGHAASSGPRN